jgi:hypothetical protein
VIGQRRVDAARLAEDLPDGVDVRLDVPLELRLAQLGEGLHLEALVVVANEHGQQAADVGVVDRHRSRSVGREVACVAILAQQVNLVSQPRQRAGQARVVDVGARAAQQVAVEDQDLHRGHPKEVGGGRNG